MTSKSNRKIIFIDGEPTKIRFGEVNRQIILGHSTRLAGYGAQVLMLRDDGPDQVLGNELVKISGGERFETLPHAAMGG